MGWAPHPFRTLEMAYAAVARGCFERVDALGTPHHEAADSPRRKGDTAALTRRTVARHSRTGAESRTQCKHEQE